MRSHLKLRRDHVRDRWVILGPERILTPNDTAVSALQLCNGERTVAMIAEVLASTYDAQPSAVTSDVLVMLQGLADSGVIRS